MTTFLSIFAFLLAAGGAVGAHLRFLSPVLGFGLFVSGVAFMGLMILPLLFMLRRWGTRDLPLVALILSIFSWVILGFAGKLAYDSPLNDVMTNTEKLARLQFVAKSYLVHADAAVTSHLDQSLQVDKTYLEENGPKQAEKFPELSSIILKATPQWTYAMIVRAMKIRLPEWKILREDPEKAQLELEVEYPIFHLHDDVMIALAPGPTPGEAQVDIRSHSRVPFTDFGFNARRLAEMKHLFEMEVASAQSPLPPLPPPQPAPVPRAAPAAPAPTPALKAGKK